MKTILVDAWDAFVTEDGIFLEMKQMLDGFDNPKIILTNANEEEKIKLGIVDMPYEVFTLSHEPDKTDNGYYRKMLEHFDLSPGDVIYFEHDTDAVESAKSERINTYWYDKEKKDLESLKKFLKNNL